MNIKKLTALVCAAVMLLMSFTGCDLTSDDPAVTTEVTTADPNADYTVKVVDYKGNVPELDILVEFNDGENMKMKKLNDAGMAVFNEKKGDYSFTLKAAKGDIYYDVDSCKFSAETTEVTVSIYNNPIGEHEVYATFTGDINEQSVPYKAQIVGEGATRVEIDRPDRAYYMFCPTRGGIYRFSYISDEQIGIGYYGESYVILRDNAIPVVDGAFELEVKNSSAEQQGVGVTIMIGLSSATVKETILVIERIGDPVKELPWTMIEAKNLPKDFPKTDGKKDQLLDVSVIDPNVKLVYNEADGFYHYGKADGPIVYVRVTEPSKFAFSFSEICENTMMCKFFYDTDGKTIIRKEGYNDLINAYAAICDESGVCPLTDELRDAIRSTGEHLKWWDFSATGNNIFSVNSEGAGTDITADNIIIENAWMFACCYLPA